MANAEARVVWHNIAHPGEPRNAAFPVVPAAVFADPQVASAGATEQDLQASGRPYIAAPPALTKTPPTAGRCRTRAVW